jgi:erythronate-4-phosphate dehydrogenase
MLRIVADENIPFLNDFFSPFGCITALPGRAMQAEDVRDADILLVRSVTQVNQQLLENSPVKFVGTCTIGVDHIDQHYLNSRGITMASAPGCNAGGVVQYVLSALAKLYPTWQKARIGIVGCGNVGGRLYAALRGAGVEVCGFDPFKSKAVNNHSADADINWVSWESVLQCDIICVHTPLTRAGPSPTWHMFNASVLEKLKPGTLLLNAGRGEVIDNLALLNRLKQQQDLTLVLDVWENEPDILVELLDYIALGTPHIAGYSYEGRINGSLMIHRALGHYLKEKEHSLHEHEIKIMAQALGDAECLYCTDLNSSLLSVYDVSTDDASLRELVAKEATTQKGFDILRKNYPQRRELSHYFVSPSLPMTPCLQALGFCV